jgi:cobalt/nickel transport system permease protein
LTRLPLDIYRASAGPIHRLRAELKIGAALLIVIGTALLPRDWAWGLAATAIILFGAAIMSRIAAACLLRWILLVEPLAIGVALMWLFQSGGFRIFLLILARSTLCAFCMALLAGTTPFSEILRVLRKARVPPLLVTTIALLHRYLFVLLDESVRMRRARLSRTFSERRTRWWLLLSTILAQLFARTTSRAERIYAAMCARGWRT